MASAFSGIFSSSFSSCLDLDRCIPETTAGSFCCWVDSHTFTHTERPTLNPEVRKPYLHVVLLHVDVQVRLPHGMAAAHERVGHRWLRLVGVVGVVVVGCQAAQAGRRDVPGKMTIVLLFIARVTRGGRERQREGEEEEERQRPGVKPSSGKRMWKRE